MVAAKKNQKDSKGREGLARRASGLLSILSASIKVCLVLL